MKPFLVLLLTSCLVNNSFAQSIIDEDPACRERCSHAGITGKPGQVTYYQYPSMDKYDLKYLKLNIAVEGGSRFISGTALTRAIALEPLDSFITELRANMVLDSVYINGTKRAFSRGSDHIFIPLSPALPAGTEVTALFYYNGTASSSAVFAGTIASNGLVYAASLSESYQAREWFPIKQVLKDKIDSSDIWIKTSSTNKAGSNGVLVAVVDSPNNKKQYQWKSRHPINYYLPSFAVGNYREYLNYAFPAQITPASVPVQHYIADNETYFQSIKTNLDKTPAFIEKFSDLFGLYPFYDEKYGHAQANIGGGMEHQTMTTTSSFSSTIIAHELGHQWWGDNVTCATWNHIWLNEGFAVYCEYLAIENLPALFAPTTAASYMQSVHSSVMSQPGGSVFVPDASIFDENRIFSSRLSYNKGAAIIHTLRFEMQDDNVFFQTLKNYQQQYGDSVATADDFKHVAETTSGKNFTDFFNEWYYGEGFPTISVTYVTDPPDSLILIISQTVSSPAVTPFFKGLYEFKITSEQGDTTIKVYITQNNQVVRFRYTKTLTGIIIDPNNWVLNNTGSIINGGTVPVKLGSFAVTGGNSCNALLNWKALTEQNLLRYEIEYSTDGSSYSVAASVPAKNIAGSAYQYNYSLGNGEIHYFRLKIIESTGHYTYSQVETVSRKCSGSYSLRILPNPVSDRLVLKISQPGKEKTTISILNAAGAIVYQDSKVLVAGENSIQLDMMNRFAPGTYLVRINNSIGTISRKFVKL